IGGIPDLEAREVHFAIKVPYALSILAKNDPHAEVPGLDRVDEKDWPNVMLTHLAFQVMVGCGTALIALGAGYWRVRWRRPGPESNRLLWALVLASPLGFIALEAGWMVTELGRQPWTIYGVMRTSEASVTSVPNPPDTVVSFYVFTALYILLGVALV